MLGLRQSKKASVASRVIGTAMIVIFVAACSSNSSKPQVKSRSKEYFAESKYGVKASPRVTSATKSLPRGGGRYQVGKAYKIQDRWFHPKEQPNYAATGVASWYGDAFHGRLTANGEIYDKTHLTAAHPTLPLPSYARVTNVNNNTSVVVRINDRGPFAHDRLIDLSERAAELLDYKHSGTAKVQVDYMGPAPLDGQDDSFLMASYRPGGQAPDPSVGMPTGVMVAMAGPTPTQTGPATSGFEAPKIFSTIVQEAPLNEYLNSQGSVILPSTAPIPQQRPNYDPYRSNVEIAALSYAEQRIHSASKLFEPILKPNLDKEKLTTWWTVKHSEKKEIESLTINIGVLTSQQQVKSIASKISQYGNLNVQENRSDGKIIYAVSLNSVPDTIVNEVLRTAWAAGAGEAFILHN